VRETNTPWEDNECYDDREFRDVKLNEGVLSDLEFDGCTFVGCKLSAAQFLRCLFRDCRFDSCDLSLMSVIDSSFRGVEFVSTKCIGVDWSLANATLGISIHATDSQFDNSILRGLTLAKCSFTNCSMKELFIDQAVLTGAIFDNCDFGGVSLREVDLRSADLSDVRGVSVDLTNCRFGDTRLSLEAARDSLSELGVEIDL